MDTVYTRLLEGDPVTPPSVKEARERLERVPDEHFRIFAVHTLEDDKPIGHVILLRIDHRNSDTWVGIGMGEPDYRGKGYGTDAMKVILRYAFQELNMHRVSLDAARANAWAIRSYEKCGFVHEGRTRGTEYRVRFSRRHNYGHLADPNGKKSPIAECEARLRAWMR